jgi:glycosyltransferase involved in cell wall biosynthesis
MRDSQVDVLYLSYDGMTDQLGQSQVLPYLIGLSKLGFKIILISFEKQDAFAAKRQHVEEIIASQLTWIPLVYHKRPPVFSTLLDLWILWRRVRFIQRTHGFSIVHCRSYITALIGLRAKSKWNLNFIFDMRGFWADERVEGGLWKLSNPIFKLIYDFFKRKEKQFLKNADYIISLTQNAKTEILSWDVSTSPIAVIPACADLVLFDTAKISDPQLSQWRTKLGIDQKDFVLLYLGSWGTWYLTSEMLNFFSLLKKKIPQSKFLIVSQDKVDLDSYADAKNVVVIKADRTEVPSLIAIANAAIFFIKPSFSKKASSATKMAEIMAMNKPIVTNPDWGDVEVIMRHYKNGFFANPFFIDSAIIDGLLHPLPRSERPDLDPFSLKHGISEYGKIYQSLLNKQLLN